MSPMRTCTAVAAVTDVGPTSRFSGTRSISPTGTTLACPGRPLRCRRWHTSPSWEQSASRNKPIRLRLAFAQDDGAVGQVGAHEGDLGVADLAAGGTVVRMRTYAEVVNYTLGPQLLHRLDHVVE